MFDLYLITPELEATEILMRSEVLLRDAPGGRIAVQLRAKHLSKDARDQLGRTLRAWTLECSMPLLVNSDLELARAIAADGVQLPEAGPSVAEALAALGPNAIIGASRHDLRGVEAAARAGASFATVSPIAAVPGKSAPLDVSGFAAIATACALPLFALGGVGVHNASALVAAGGQGVAVIRELYDSPRPETTRAQLLAAIEAGRARRRER